MDFRRGVGFFACITVLLSLVVYKLAKGRKNYVYRKPLVDKIGTLNPRQTRVRTDYVVAKAILGQWLIFNNRGEVDPSAIESWEVNNKGDEFLFKINKKMKFHSGKKLTVNDFIYSIHFFSENKSLMQHYFKGIVGFKDYIDGKTKSLRGVSKVSEDTVRVKLSEPSFVFLVNLADPKITVLPENLNGKNEKSFFNNPDGVGPYFLKYISSDKSKIFLSRNSSFHGETSDILRYEMEAMDKKSAISRFNLGELDDLELFQIKPSEEKMINKERSMMFSASTYSTIVIFFNGKSKLFRNREKRKVLRVALGEIKYSEICSEKLIKASGVFPKGMTGWLNPRLLPKVRKVNNRLHRENLAHLRGKKIRFLSYGKENKDCMLSAIKRKLSDGLGMLVEHLEVDEKRAVEIFKKNSYDIFLDHLSVRTREPYHFMTYFDPHSTHDLIKFGDEKVSEIIGLIRKTPSPSLRAQLYRRLDEHISVKEGYVIPLVYDVRNFYYNRALKKRGIRGRFNIYDSFISVGRE